MKQPTVDSVELTHRSIESNGIKLHVVQAGPDTGPLILLLHGFPEFWYGWRAQIAALAQAGYRLWIPDQRGYNLSEKPTGLDDYNVDRLAADVIGLIDAAGVKDAILVGAHEFVEGFDVSFEIPMDQGAVFRRTSGHCR